MLKDLYLLRVEHLSRDCLFRLYILETEVPGAKIPISAKLLSSLAGKNAANGCGLVWCLPKYHPEFAGL
jgi:hypothetical protein